MLINIIKTVAQYVSGTTIGQPGKEVQGSHPLPVQIKLDNHPLKVYLMNTKSVICP